MSATYYNVTFANSLTSFQQFVFAGNQNNYNTWSNYVFLQNYDGSGAGGALTTADIDACFARLGELIGVDIDLRCCVHDAGPPACWCRKPLPGSVLDFALARGAALDRSLVVAQSAADRTMALRLGIPVADAQTFFGR